MVADPGSWVPGAGYERNRYSLYTTKKMQARKQAYDGLMLFHDGFAIGHADINGYVFSTHYTRHEPKPDNCHNCPHHVLQR